MTPSLLLVCCVDLLEVYSELNLLETLLYCLQVSLCILLFAVWCPSQHLQSNIKHVYSDFSLDQLLDGFQEALSCSVLTLRVSLQQVSLQTEADVDLLYSL